MLKFPNISYDLSQNILRYNNEMESLKNHSLNLCIGSAVKESFISDYDTIRWFINAKTTGHRMYDDLKEIEEKVDDKILELLESKFCESEFTYSMRKPKIHFIFMQLIDFLTKKKTCLHLVDEDNFVPLMVFNGKGTINMSKSAFRYSNTLQENSLENFTIKCHFFLKREIEECYDTLKDEEKLTVFGDAADDYILQFWKLEIKSLQSKGKSLNKDSQDINSDQLQSFFLRAIETNNEIAVAYLWNNNVSKLKKRKTILKVALNLFVGDSLKTNIIMFLLFQVRKNEFDEFFELSFFKIIESMVKEVRWHCVFNKIVEMLNAYRLSKIFGIVTDSHFKVYPEGINLDSVVNFFGSLPDSVKIFIINESIIPGAPLDSKSSTSSIINKYERLLTKVVDSGKKDFIQKLTKDRNGTDLKQSLNSESILRKQKRFKKY